MKYFALGFFVPLLMAVTSTFAEAADYSGSGYSTQGVRQQGNAIKGEVIEVRSINIETSSTTSTIAQTAGAVIGGAVGAGVAGDNMYAKIVAGTLGGVLGGVAGDKAAEMIGGQQGLEVIVATENGDAIVISQSASDGASFAIGDKVWVVKSGGAVRAVRRSTVRM